MWVYKRRRKRILLLFLFILLIFILAFFMYQLKIIFNTLSQSKIYAISLQTINNVVNKKMSEIDYNSLISFEKKENDEITIVNTNIVLMNQIANEISHEIITKMENLEPLYISVPLGSISGNQLIAGSGPIFNIKFIPVSEVKTDFKTDFSSTGINQTKHKIFLNVYCDVEALSSFLNNHITVEMQIPILETIIIGGVPSTYYHFEGMENEDALEISG